MANKARKTAEARTTVGLKQSTKEKLDMNRAPGQCYDGFICQMVELWEEIKNNEPNRGNTLAKKREK